MLALFHRSRPAKAKRNPRYTNLAVEALEARDVPALLGDSLTLGVQVLPGQGVQLSGVVAGRHVADATVLFSGAVTGSTTTDAAGNYALTTNSATLGLVFASVEMKGNLLPATASAIIAVAAPSVTLSMTQMTDDTVTLAGTLKDIDAAGPKRSTISGGASPGPVVTHVGKGTSKLHGPSLRRSASSCHRKPTCGARRPTSPPGRCRRRPVRQTT